MVLLLDKPLTWTSFDVVRKVKHALRIKKIGHAGTLDPLATGLLILCTGKKTKEIDLIQAQEKEYAGTFRLGETTPSFDLETAVDLVRPYAHITAEQIDAAITAFMGTTSRLSTPQRIVFSARSTFPMSQWSARLLGAGGSCGSRSTTPDRCSKSTSLLAGSCTPSGLDGYPR